MDDEKLEITKLAAKMEDLPTVKKGIENICSSVTGFLNDYPAFACHFDLIELELESIKWSLSNLKWSANNDPYATAGQDVPYNLEDEKLSETANAIITSIQNQPDSENFRDLLMDKIRGKPKPPVLPVIRTYTGGVNGFVQQMKELKKALNESHTKYKEQRRLDINLINRIDRLVRNINKEVEVEAKAGQHQAPIDQYLT